MLNSQLDRGVLLVGPRVHENRVSGARLGFELTITAFRRSGIRHEVLNTVVGTVERAGAFDVKRVFSSLIVVFSFLRKLPRNSEVCLTIGSSLAGFLRDALLIWPGSLMGRKIILRLFGGGFGRFYAAQPAVLRGIIRRTFERASMIIVEGGLLREQFEFLPDIDRKIRVVPNGLPDNLRPRVSAAKSWSPGSPVRLLYLSNMIESKGYLSVLAACRILKEKYDLPIHCDFCGEFVRIVADGNNVSGGEAEGRFHALIDRWHLGDVVKYHGIVGGVHKQRLLTEAHLFVLPTRYPWEGQPFSIIEALAFGTPVIATCYRGIPELVKAEYNGFFVEPDDPDQIAEVVGRLVKNPDLFRVLSENALAHYEKNFTTEKHLERIVETIMDAGRGD